MRYSNFFAASFAVLILIGAYLRPVYTQSGSVLPVDASGNVKVAVQTTVNANGAASAVGSAVPATGDYVAINVGGTLRGATGVNPSGSIFAQQFDLASIAGNTVATAATGIIKVGLTDGSGTALTSTSNALNVNVTNGSQVDGNSYAITSPGASATSGLAALPCNILSAASTNTTNCKASAGNLYGLDLFNTTTTVYYLRLYNLATAPTCSSATGFIRTIPIPPAGASGGVGGVTDNFSAPVNFGTGIGYCITGGSGSTDNTNAAVGVFGEIRYK